MVQGANERGLSGRAAAIARRRRIADGGKVGAPPAGPNRAAKPSEPRPESRREVPSGSSSATGPAPKPASRGAGNSVPFSAGRQRAMAQRSRMTQGRTAVQLAAKGARTERLTGLTGRDAAVARRRQMTGAPVNPAGANEQAAPTPAATGRSVRTDLAATSAPAAGSSRRTTPASRPRTLPKAAPAMSRGRRLSMARRAATAATGRNGLKAMGNQSGGSATAAIWREAGASSREIAKKVRQERCEQGKSCSVATRPTGRVRPKARTGQDSSSDADGSSTAAGQRLSGTRVGRSSRTTGDEPGACARVTGTEYFGSEVFQEFCGLTPEPQPAVEPVTTEKGQTVTGNRVGRSARVTGDEPGAGRVLTGTPYTGAAQGGSPTKVGVTKTYSGGSVTGSLVGRSTRVTGDEPGSCRRVTGNEYVGSEQYADFCETKPEPSSYEKVGRDATWQNQSVTGTRVGRAERVTGDEPGTCETVTGTSYVGPVQYQSYCPPPAAEVARQRVRTWRDTPGASLTGQSPGPGGGVTGDERGVCHAVTGTPYVGSDQYFAQCGQGADSAPGSADFPQPLTGGNWGAFSVQSPARAAQATRVAGMVTGTSYSQEEGRITGSFNLGRGVVTGTEDFRRRQDGDNQASALPMAMHPAPQDPPTQSPEPAAVPEVPRSRVTGEGMDRGARITGDDWGRNERVTGTEGHSVAGRNPTRRGGVMGAFAGARAFQESQAREAAQLHVTGSSGGTDRGAMVTVSGGARG